MRKLSLLLLLMANCGAMIAQNNVKIKGHVKFIEDDFKVTVYQRVGTGKNVLAETVVNPQTQDYELSVPISKAGTAVLDCGMWQSVNVWLDDEDLTVDFRGLDTAKVKIKNPPYVFIKGGKKNDLMNLINFEDYRNYQSMIAYSQAAYKAKFADDENKNTLTSTLYGYNNENSDAHSRFFVEHYADRNSVMVPISRLDYDKDKELIDNAFETLRKNDPNAESLITAYLKNEADRKERIERMKEGNPAPEFTFQNVKGKEVKLSKLRGKVVVLDFWASWCGPCRAEIPNLKSIYADYKDKGVEFLSVSIDAKKDAWTKALAEEGMTWQLGWVPDGGKKVMEDYQFGGIPFILVLDKEGNIYRKWVRGEDIRKAIQDCLDGKPSKPKTVTGISMGAMMM